MSERSESNVGLTDLLGGAAATPKPRVVVRIRTTAWNDHCGMYTKKSLSFARRQCEGHNYVEEDLSCIGAEETLQRITNLDACQDGLYEVAICNESTDWETGYVDDYEYELRPIAPPNTAMQTLGEYRSAMNAIHERESPTFMGEPVTAGGDKP